MSLFLQHFIPICDLGPILVGQQPRDIGFHDYYTI